MNIYKSTLFPYIAGDSLVGKQVAMTMDRVATEAIPTRAGKAEEKLVLYFRETGKGMILNKTNAKRIAKLFGGETDAWGGHVIELYTEEVQAFGDTHNAIRVRESKHVKQVQAAKAKAAGSTLQERKQRQAGNEAILRGPDEGPIGEEEQGHGWQRFAEMVMDDLNYYGERGTVELALGELGLEYDRANEPALYDALAAYAEKHRNANGGAPVQPEMFPQQTGGAAYAE